MVPCVHQYTTIPPRANHAVLPRRHQHYSIACQPPTANRKGRTRVRPSIPLRTPADPDPRTHPLVPITLVASLPAFQVPPSQSSSARPYTRHVVHRLGRRLRHVPSSTPVALPRFFSGIH
jgi:hypothetical protein